MSYGWKGNEWRRMTGKPRWRHFVTRKPSVEGLQRVWWLFPLYRERPTELDELLTASLSAL